MSFAINGQFVSLQISIEILLKGAFFYIKCAVAFWGSVIQNEQTSYLLLSLPF